MQELDKVIESEREVLGSIINDNSLMIKVIDNLKDTDFYSGSHQLLYKTMKTLYKHDCNFDAVILINRLKEEIKENIIKVTEITNISMQGIGATFKSHLAAIIESSRQRKLTKLMEDVTHSNKNSLEKIDYIQNELMKINTSTEDDKIYNTSELLETSMKKIQEAYNNKGGITGVPTGFEELDNAINGLQKKNMIVFGARPSIGRQICCLC